MREPAEPARVTTATRRSDGARATARALEAWYRNAKRDLPWRRTRDPYRIWVAEIMLQQTTVRAVIPYYKRFLKAFPTVRALARAPLPRVLAAWSGLGYYRRARHLHAAARRVVEAHGGVLPDDEAGLRALPGIGRYTAGAIRSIAFGARAPILDGNVARVLARLFALRGPVAAHHRRLWDEAALVVAEARAPGDFNQALMELGALVCTPERPACGACPLRRRCRARAQGAQETIPAPRRRRTPVEQTQVVALIERRGRYLMRRRVGTPLMDGLWEFPAVRDDGDDTGGAGDTRDVPDVASDGLRLRMREPVAALRHTITHRNIRVEVRRAGLLAEPRGSGWRWVDPDSLSRLPVSSLVLKVLDRAGAPRAGIRVGRPFRPESRPGRGV